MHILLSTNYITFPILLSAGLEQVALTPGLVVSGLVAFTGSMYLDATTE